MSEPYQPEIGQMLFGAPTGEYDIGPLGKASLHSVLDAIRVTFWNREQRAWNDYEDPRIAGLDFRPYDWGDDDAQRDLPNLQIVGDDLEIRWYKYPGRGTTINREMSPNDWDRWLRRALGHVLDSEVPDAD